MVSGKYVTGVKFKPRMGSLHSMWAHAQLRSSSLLDSGGGFLEDKHGEQVLEPLSLPARGHGPPSPTKEPSGLARKGAPEWKGPFLEKVRSQKGFVPAARLAQLIQHQAATFCKGNEPKNSSYLSGSSFYPDKSCCMSPVTKEVVAGQETCVTPFWF